MADPDVVFHPEASEEYSEAFAWYFERSEEIALRFEREVDHVVQLIREAPGRWPAYDELHRKLLLPRYPYLLIYRQFKGRVWIVAVAHAHRRPGYWKDRSIDA